LALLDPGIDEAPDQFGLLHSGLSAELGERGNLRIRQPDSGSLHNASMPQRHTLVKPEVREGLQENATMCSAASSAG